MHEKLEQYPIQYQHDYNFYGYIVNNDPLDQSNITIYENRDENIVTKDIFVQQIYYQRRSDYGKAKVKVETLQ